MGRLAAAVLFFAAAQSEGVRVDNTNLAGEFWIGIQAVENVDGLLVSTSAGARLPSGNAFQADGMILSHDTYVLTPTQAGEFAAGMQTWHDAPHSDSVYRIPGDEIAFVVVGSAIAEPYVVIQIQKWANFPGGHHHNGGPYIILNQQEARDVAVAIQAWLDKPTLGFVYQKSIR